MNDKLAVTVILLDEMDKKVVDLAHNFTKSFFINASFHCGHLFGPLPVVAKTFSILTMICRASLLLVVLGALLATMQAAATMNNNRNKAIDNNKVTPQQQQQQPTEGLHQSNIWQVQIPVIHQEQTKKRRLGAPQN